MINARKILKYIKDHNGKYQQNIISFNYSDLSKSKEYKKNGEIYRLYNKIRHVHSTWFNDPIIGIDSNLAFNKDYYMFTKTYRIMSLTNNANKNQDLEYNQKILPDVNDINNVIFYGHSLGKQDYSYFIAIFDYYHIYNSDVNLVFYYSQVPKENFDITTKDQYTKVFKLINKYGLSINHGGNLLHKLLLENRLHIQTIPDVSKIPDVRD